MKTQFILLATCVLMGCAVEASKSEDAESGSAMAPEEPWLKDHLA